MAKKPFAGKESKKEEKAEATKGTGVKKFPPAKGSMSKKSMPKAC